VLFWATSIPAVETRRLEATSKLLYHLSFEFAADTPFIGPGAGKALLRIHHRSGPFGLFGNVAGGNDYVCLGLRKRW
jgi:hypothetical protein